jgi:hypothetical protein
MNENEYRLPPPQTYRGPSGVMRNSPWLTGEDIPNNMVVPVTIEAVYFRPEVRFKPDSEPEPVYSLKLRDKKKELRINNTTRKTLNEMFGPDTASWVGQSIGLRTVQQMVAGKMLTVIVVVQAQRGSGAPANSKHPVSGAEHADVDELPEIPF